ncbi:hypothetical protein G653_04886 [Candidatus Liberibacter americanus PW_SP]|nr:hypothetical protein G653_04886 [Candidatus Liberibacter americanus PW_SP]
MNRDKSDFFMINLITWFIAWAIPLTFTKDRWNWDYIDYTVFGIFLVLFCLLSFYFGCRIITSYKFKKYMQEYSHKIKEPFFIAFLFFCLCIITPHTGRMTYDIYKSYGDISTIIKLLMLCLENTLLSIVYLKIYRAIRRK